MENQRRWRPREAAHCEQTTKPLVSLSDELIGDGQLVAAAHPMAEEKLVAEKQLVDEVEQLFADERLLCQVQPAADKQSAGEVEQLFVGGSLAVPDKTWQMADGGHLVAVD